LGRERRRKERTMRFAYEGISASLNHGLRLARIIAWFAIIPAMGCCCRDVRPGDVSAAVPVGSERLSFALTEDTERIAAAAACLIRTGSAGADCNDPNTPRCDLRKDEDVRAEYRAAIEAIRGVALTGPLAFGQEIRMRVGGDAVGTVHVADSRRTLPCRVKNEKEGWCGAVRYKELWFLLKRRAAVPGPAQEMEVFLAGQPCRGGVNSADAR